MRKCTVHTTTLLSSYSVLRYSTLQLILSINSSRDCQVILRGGLRVFYDDMQLDKKKRLHDQKSTILPSLLELYTLLFIFYCDSRQNEYRKAVCIPGRCQMKVLYCSASSPRKHPWRSSPPEAPLPPPRKSQAGCRPFEKSAIAIHMKLTKNYSGRRLLSLTDSKSSTLLVLMVQLRYNSIYRMTIALLI